MSNKRALGLFTMICVTIVAIMAIILIPNTREQKATPTTYPKCRCIASISTAKGTKILFTLPVCNRENAVEDSTSIKKIFGEQAVVQIVYDYSVPECEVQR